MVHELRSLIKCALKDDLAQSNVESENRESSVHELRCGLSDHFLLLIILVSIYKSQKLDVLVAC